MSVLNETVARSLIETSNVPIVFRGYVDWPIRHWNLDKWNKAFADKKYPFRCNNKHIYSDDPCWERKCIIKQMTFKDFIDAAGESELAMYFDYKYLHEWFSAEDEVSKGFSWAHFGFPEKGVVHTTLWVGSAGAHTAAHQDTYGVNIVTQVYGKKRWILFPPETEGLQPTRIPYEESSVYSSLNFYCPGDVEVFKELSGARVLDLSAGDALLVPHKWWHYVQNIDPVNISMNMWLPHEEDDNARMSEAVIKIFVAQLCKDLPAEDIKSLVNPTEDDLVDTPLSVLLTQLEAAKNRCEEKSRKSSRRKRQKTNDNCVSSDTCEDFDLNALVANLDNKLDLPLAISGTELVQVIEQNKSLYSKKNETGEEQSRNVEKKASTLSLVQNLINAFCQNNVVEQLQLNLVKMK